MQMFVSDKSNFAQAHDYLPADLKNDNDFNNDVNQKCFILEYVIMQGVSKVFQHTKKIY